MMSTEYLLPVLRLTVVLVLVTLAGSAFALDEAQFRSQVEEFLADEALPQFELEGSMRTQDAQDWPDEGVVRAKVGQEERRREHYVILDEASGAVVGFIAAEPTPPVPMDEMPAEEAVGIAKQFAQRHLPELFADGGEVAVTVEDEISPRGGRVVHLQRTVQGVQVPTLADVGVRVYDGKVVHWRRHHVPAAEGLQLPGTVDLDQAKQIASENVPYKDHAPVFWFDEAHRVIVTNEGQRNVWDLWAEIKQATTPEKRLEFFAHWQIDATSGEVLLSDGIDPGKDVDLRRRYYAAGGQHVSPDYGRPQPEVIVEDRQPIFAPDGSILFLSDRPREGYPAWLRHSGGLFAMNADGSELRCVSAAHEGEMPQFSPDGSRMLVREQDGLHVLPLDGGEEVFVPKPSGGDFLSAGWASDTMLLADSGDAFGGGELMKVDLTQPEPTAEPAGIPRGTGENFISFAPAPDGTVLCGFYGQREGNDWDIIRINLSVDPATTEVVCADPQEGRGLQLLDNGMLVLSDTRLSRDSSPTFVLSLADGTVQKWQAPRMEMPGTDGKRLLQPMEVAFSPDGARMVFSARVEDLAREKAPAVLIFTANADGTDVQQVTPWESALVPMAE